MPDSPNPPGDQPPEYAETERSGGADLTSRSGGADLTAQGDITVGGDVVGRDKTTTFDQRGQHVDRQINVAGDYIAAPVPGVSSLHQLPPPPRDFTGREAELNELMKQAA